MILAFSQTVFCILGMEHEGRHACPELADWQGAREPGAVIAKRRRVGVQRTPFRRCVVPFPADVIALRCQTNMMARGLRRELSQRDLPGVKTGLKDKLSTMASSSAKPLPCCPLRPGLPHS